MPTAPAVKELLAARAQRGDDVLQVRRGSCNRTEGRGIERTPPHSEKRDRGHPARHFEAAVGDVLVRNAVCGQVEDRPEQKRAEGEPTAAPTAAPVATCRETITPLPIDRSS